MLNVEPVASATLAEMADSDPADGFGDVLRRHRRAAGFTQEQLAEHAGLSPRSISGLERGEEVTPRRDTVALLVRALGLAGAERAGFEAMVDRRRGPPPTCVLADLPPTSLNQCPRPQHNLPRSLTSFVGRDREMSELGQVLMTAPLVTLIGAGGSGKTRLALQLARNHVAGYADGVWLVGLGELADPSLVASAIATVVACGTFMPEIRRTDCLTIWATNICCWCWTIVNTSSPLARSLSATCSVPVPACTS